MCSVPKDTFKSTLDCQDGYHGVPLAPEDRHKTTFITEQGRFRYARAPQGYGSSNDGYTQRTDAILSGCPGKPEVQDYDKIVDDIIQWSDSMEQAFNRMCSILSNCSKAGMVFNPDKFQFAKTSSNTLDIWLAAPKSDPQIATYKPFVISPHHRTLVT